MKTPFSLHCCHDPQGPVTGLLLLSSDPAEVLDLCAGLGQSDGRSAFPTLFAVAGGFLLRLTHPAQRVGLPGVICLWQQAPNLFLPVAAELWPTLFPDEATALTQKRGLVFLPGGQVLAFEPDRPVPLASLLAVRRLERGSFRPLPQPPPLADRLTQVLLDRAEDSPEAIISAGGEDIGTEQPEPPKAGPAGWAGAQVKQGVGTGLSWLGQKLGWNQLAQAGASMANAARHLLQGLSDSIRERQEAALRELLRQFQEGKLEDALRHALPLGEPAGRGSQASTNASLPTHNTSYSLGNILGGSGGLFGYWMGGAEVQNQLAAEYRKAAQAATARGDFRRAAFIYGKLLRDYRQAADMLSRGGLHHDAAVLYLDKLGDILAAAQAFAAAGEFDRAVQLYRQSNKHLLAGDLLRRLGEEQQALVEYETAIERLLLRDEFHAAGDLALTKLSSPERARDYFHKGWQRRPRGSPLPCLHGLAGLLAESPADLLALVDEAAAFLQGQGSESDCAAFFNEVVRLAQRPGLAGVRDRLRDRALLGLAARLRNRARVETAPGNLVSTLFGQAGTWSADQVSDAAVALKGALQKRAARSTPLQRGGVAQRAFIQSRLHEGTVLTACSAVEKGKLFVAFTDGALRCFHPEGGMMDILPSLTGVPCSLATDPQGRILQALSALEGGGYELVSFLCVEEFGQAQLLTRKVLHDLGPGAQLAPLVFVSNEPRGAIWWEEGFVALQGSQALPVAERGRGDFGQLVSLLLGVLPVPTLRTNRLLLLEDQSATLCWRPHPSLTGTSLGWIAQPAAGLLSSQVFWAERLEDRVKVWVVRVGDQGGQLFWSCLLVTDENGVELRASATTKVGGYLGASLLSSGAVWAIREGGIDLFGSRGRTLERLSSTTVNLTGACGCFPSPVTGELLVLCRDGYLLRMATPR